MSAAIAAATRPWGRPPVTGRVPAATAMVVLGEPVGDSVAGETTSAVVVVPPAPTVVVVSPPANCVVDGIGSVVVVVPPPPNCVVDGIGSVVVVVGAEHASGKVVL